MNSEASMAVKCSRGDLEGRVLMVTTQKQEFFQREANVALRERRTGSTLIDLPQGPIRAKAGRNHDVGNATVYENADVRR